MTAPTPQMRETREVAELRATLVSLTSARAELARERTQHEATKSTLDKAWDELRQARQMLADAQKRIDEMELDESLREEEARWGDTP